VYFNNVDKTLHAQSQWIGKTIKVVYSYKVIKPTLEDIDNELMLPDSLIDCLLLYIAYKAYTLRDPDADGTGIVYYKKYMGAVERAKITHKVNVYKPKINSLNEKCFV